MPSSCGRPVSIASRADRVAGTLLPEVFLDLEVVEAVEVVELVELVDAVVIVVATLDLLFSFTVISPNWWLRASMLSSRFISGFGKELTWHSCCRTEIPREKVI